MSPLIWTPEALADIQRLVRFQAVRDSHTARQMIAAIRESARGLACPSACGERVKALPPSFREWAVPVGHDGYRMLYCTEGERVVVLAVRHQGETGQT